MSCVIQKDLGNVIIENEVIAKTAGLAAMECCGVVGMAANNIKEGFVQLLLGENLSKGVRVNTTAGTLTIELHIIVEYGTNISAIAENLMSTVSYRLKDVFGLKADDISVFVEGIRTPSSEEE